MNAPGNIDHASICSIELEQEVLGAVLVYGAALEIIEREIYAGDFFEPLHSEIFEAFQRVRDAHGTITPALVKSAIGSDAGQIIGGNVNRGQYIARLASMACVMGQARAYILIARGLLDHPQFKPRGPFTQFEAWFWLIESAAYVPRDVTITNGRNRLTVRLCGDERR
jgi:hypothetical protein